MTTAAGLRCVDGVVLCTATEMSAGYSKFSRSKFGVYDKLNCRPAFIYTGDRDFSFMAMQQIAKDIARAIPENIDIVEAIQNKASEIYQRYFHLSTENRILELQAIVAVHLNQKENRLFLIRGPTVSPIDHAECIGMGSSLGTYVLQTMLSRTATVWEAAHVAAYLLFLTKTHGACRGRESQIMIFTNQGGSRIFPDGPLQSVSINEMEVDFSALQFGLGKVLTNLVNFKLENNEYGDILKGFAEQMEALRTKQARQIQDYIQMEIER